MAENPLVRATTRRADRAQLRRFVTHGLEGTGEREIAALEREVAESFGCGGGGFERDQDLLEQVRELGWFDSRVVSWRAMQCAERLLSVRWYPALGTGRSRA